MGSMAKGMARLAVLGTALSGAAVRAQDSDGQPLQSQQPASVGQDAAARLPYEIQSEALPALQAERAGISLIEASKASQLLDSFASQIALGKKPPAEQVRELFTILSQEPGTDMRPERYRWFVTNYNQPDVRVAMLKYIYFSPHNYLSAGTLANFFSVAEGQLPDAEVIRWALLNRSKVIDATVAEDFFKNVRVCPLPDIRIATALALISAGHRPLDLNSQEIIKASLLLTQDHLAAGHEVRLVQMLAARLRQHATLKLEPEVVDGLCAPTLHLIQRAFQRHPKLNEILNKASPQQVDRFCAKILSDLHTARAEILDRPVLSAEAKTLVALHYERDFTHIMTQTLFSKLGVSDFKILKAGELENEPSGDYGEELFSVQDSEQRREFLADLDEIKTKTPKSDYLERLRQLANERDCPTLAWSMMHGSPRQFWFYQGRAGEEPDDYLRHPRGVSDLEVAETIVTEEMLKQAEIDLSNMTIILDACRQYTVAEGILAGIEQIARRAGAEVKGYPCIVALTQPGMYGSLTLSRFYTEVEIKNSKGEISKASIAVGSTIYSPFDDGMRQSELADSKINQAKLIEIGDDIRRKHWKELSDPRRLRAFSSEHNSDPNDLKTDSLGLRGMNTQDPAIFGTRPMALEPFIDQALEAAEIDPEGLNLDQHQPTFIEIATDWSSDSRGFSV